MFYGWRIVGIAAAAQGVSAGVTFYSYGIFVKPLAAEFDAPRLVVVFGLTLLMFTQGIVSPALGRALDARSVRALMAGGILVCAVGFVGLSLATRLWQIGFLFTTLVGVGAHMFGPLATATLVANWFVRQRGKALGVTAVGASLGGLIFPVAATRLVEAFGWRGTAEVFAVILVLFAVPVWLMVVNRPEDMGTGLDGDLRGAPTAMPGDANAGEIALLTSRNFWSITAAIGLAFCPVSVMLAHLVPYATDLGIEPQRAAFLMSAYAGASAAGRLLFGFMADRLDNRVAMWIALLLLIAAWAGLVVAPSYPALLAASAGLGVGVGGIMPLWGSLTGACFGRAVFGRAMGLMNPLMLPFNLAGAPIAAYVYDETGSYTLVFTAFLGTLIASASVIALIRIPTVEPAASV